MGKELDPEIPGTVTARRKLPELLVVVVVMVRGRGVKRRHCWTVLFIIVVRGVDFAHHHF